MKLLSLASAQFGPAVLIGPAAIERAIRYPPSDRNYLIFAPKGIASTTPDPFNDWRGGGDVTNLSPFWEGKARK